MEILEINLNVFLYTMIFLFLRDIAYIINDEYRKISSRYIMLEPTDFAKRNVEENKGLKAFFISEWIRWTAIILAFIIKKIYF